MARQLVYEQFKEDTYTRGLNVFTTITKADQDAAYLALRKGVMDYERRHAYRGPEAYIDIPPTRKRRTTPSRPRWPTTRTTTTSSPPWCCGHAAADYRRHRLRRRNQDHRPGLEMGRSWLSDKARRTSASAVAP
jgi:penicillin-binding protein 1A